MRDNPLSKKRAPLAAVATRLNIYVPLHLVVDDLRSGRLGEVLSSWSKPELPIHILRPSRRHLPRRVAVLIETLALGLRDEVGGKV